MGTVQISFALPNSILITYLKLEFTEKLIKSIFFFINRRNIFWNKKLKRIETSCKPFKKVYAKLSIFICTLLAVKSSYCFPLKPDFYSSTCKYLHCNGNLMWSQNGRCWMIAWWDKALWFGRYKVECSADLYLNHPNSYSLHKWVRNLVRRPFQERFMMFLFSGQRRGKTHQKVGQNSRWVDLDQPQIINHVVHCFSFAATRSPRFVSAFILCRKKLLPAK